MDFRIRIVGLVGLLIYYIIQCVLILSPHFHDTITDHNDQSWHGLVGVDVLLIVVVFVYLLLKCLGLTIIDRLIVLFDSFIFAFSYAWLVLAAPVAAQVAGFFIINFCVATGILFIDLWEFRQFSHAYQRNRSQSATNNLVNDNEGHNEMHAVEKDIESQTVSSTVHSGELLCCKWTLIGFMCWL